MKNQEGIQTRITPIVTEEANKISGKGLQLLENIIKYIHKNYRVTRSEKIPHRTRTVDKIIKSRILTGCTDFAHLFIAMCRAKNIPALYVETFKRSWLENPTKNYIEGHIFVEVKIGKSHYMVDPTSGSINVLGRVLSNYKIMCKGIDYGTLFPNKATYLRKIKETFGIDL